MRDDLIETLRDCANALGELLPREHAYRRLMERANRLLDRHDQASEEQRAADALRDLMDALPAGTQTSMTVFRPEVDGQKAGTIKANLQAEVTRLRELSDEMFATMVAALSLTPQDCGAYGVLDDAIKNLQPKWIRSAMEP
jgi:5-formyltetrahydrofolate cyclo-ligase